MTPPDDATRLLHRIAEGDTGAADRLLPLVYAELHRLAARSMEGQAADHTLQATALVHEAYLKLIDLREPAWEGRRHFLSVAARAMRTVLVDHSRARRALKRGSGRRAVALDESSVAGSGGLEGVLELHEALEFLADLDPELAHLVELRFFAGLTVEESAEVLGVSPRTVKRNWRVARAWLRRFLTEQEDDDETD